MSKNTYRLRLLKSEIAKKHVQAVKIPTETGEEFKADIAKMHVQAKISLEAIAKLRARLPRNRCMISKFPLKPFLS